MQDKSDFQNIMLSFMEIKGFPVEQYTILCFCVFKKNCVVFLENHQPLCNVCSICFEKYFCKTGENGRK